MITKKLLLILIVGLIIGSQQLFAQDDIFAPIEKVAKDEETKQIEKAKTALKKGDEFMKQVKPEDDKTKKYFDDKKKEKKGEKKAAPAKFLRVQAMNQYEKAYQILFDLYKARLTDAKFIFPDDSQTAFNLQSEAENDFNSGKTKYSTYKKQKEEDLAKVAYASLKTDIASAKALEISAIKKQIEAFGLLTKQEDKKVELEKKEEQDWQDAVSLNTKYAFSGYKQKYPNGKYTAQANTKITEFEEAEKQAELIKTQQENEKKQDAGLVYKVQIAASPVQLDQSKLSAIYFKTGDIVMRQADGMYKYSLGSFSKYEDAKKYKKQIQVRGAFVVCFKEGKQINVKEGQKLESKK